MSFRKHLYHIYALAGRGKWLVGAALSALLLSRPEAAADGAARAMAGWYRAVAPALFPFMALLPLLTCEEAACAYEALLGRATSALFRLPGAAAPALVIGMVGGSPAGALAARRLAAQAGMTQGQLRRIAVSAAGLSPAFLLSGIGAGLLGDVGSGWVLLRAQLGTQLAMALLLRHAWDDCADPVPAGDARADAAPVRGAVLAVLGVCGWMALFGALASAARAWIGDAADALLCLLDLPSGAGIVAALPMDPARRLALLSAMCGFGGACVGAQNLAALKGCGLSPAAYFALRAVAAAVSAALTLAQLRLPVLLSGRAAPPPMPAASLAAVALAVPVLRALRRKAA